MEYGPIIRIVLRYVVGAGFMGSVAIGDQLAADPDIVMGVSLAIGAAVEVYSYIAKTYGKAT
jgi:preprotein translocase subunit Sec61beta